MRSRSSVVALCVASCWLPAQGTVQPTLLQARAAEAASPLRQAGLAGVVAAVRSAVVWVLVEVDGERGKFALERASSGVVVDADGWIVTWAKLVREAADGDKSLFVQLDDAENTRLPAVVARIDDATGLALLKVAPPAAGLRVARLGPDVPAAGEPLVVVARPAGKEMLAFSGVVNHAVGAVALGGTTLPPDDLFLTDSRNDERCDGAPVFDAQQRLLGLYSSEHVQRDKELSQDPAEALRELRRPSFGIAVSCGVLRRAFAKEFAAAKNATLAKAPAAGAPHAQAAAVARIASAVVSVFTGSGEWPRPAADDPGGVQRREDLGSGVVVSAAGLVVANAHVSKHGAVRVRTADGRTLPAKVVKSHGATNLALLQVELPAGATLPAADCAADDDVTLGETVLAVGNPFGTRCVVAGGVVSAKRDREGGRIQADCALGPQNGGGAVVDVTGRVLGIGDAGVRDPLEMEVAMRNDRVTTDTNLSTFVGIARVRKAFAAELEAAGAQESIRAPAKVAAADRQLRTSALAAMVQKTSGALLNVYVERNTAVAKEDDLFPPEPKWVPFSLGSGVLIDGSGLAISNWHVVDDATNPDGSMVADHRVRVRVFGGKEYGVKVLSISRENDLSLLQLELAPGETVAAVELGSSDALAIGEAVAAIGNPLGHANTITSGAVTAKGQELRIRHRFEKLAPLIETDAAINGGNSGGALLDMDGRLVGINSAGGGTFNNKGYAIEVDHVRKTVLGLLFAAYKLRSPDLGMRVYDDGGKVLVLDVDARGPAAKAGVQPNDRIAALDGVAITWSPGFALQLAQKTPGAELVLALERKGAAVTVKAVPLSAAQWAVVKQSGLLTRDFAFAENPERVRAAAIALHRAFTGDVAGEPRVIPENVIAIDTVFAGEQPADVDVAAGDLLLAIELRRTGSDSAVLAHLAGVGKLRDLWNDRLLGKYEQEGSQAWKCWVERGGKVRTVELRAHRLFW